MEISINTAGATKRELLLVAGLFTSLADVTDYARTTSTAAVIAPADRPDVGAPEPVRLVTPPVPLPAADMAASFGAPLPSLNGGALPPLPRPPEQVAAPLPPTAPPVPYSPAPILPSAATAPTDAPAVDSRGMLWDVRIHSGAKSTNADGRWKARKGLNDPDMVARVEAELLGQPAPAAAPQVPQPPPPPPFVPGAGQSVVPGHGASMPPMPPAPGGMVTTYQALQTEVIALMTCGKLDPVLMQTLCQGVGVEHLGLMGLPTNADKIPALWAAIREQVGQ